MITRAADQKAGQMGEAAVEEAIAGCDLVIGLRASSQTTSTVSWRVDSSKVR